jgi:hypothetical protein
MVISSWNSFTIYWEKPDKVHSHYPIIGYRIEWRNFSDELRIHEDTVLPNVTMYIVPGLLPNHEYRVMVSALTEAGSSFLEDWYSVQTNGRQPSVPSNTSADDSGAPVVVIAGLVGGGIILISVIVVISLIAIKLEKLKHGHHLSQLKLEAFQPPVLPPVLGQAEEPDEWEIDPGNLNLLQVLGEGFLGIVLKGEVYHYGPPITATEVRPLGTIPQGEMKGRAGTVKMEKSVVACKMLKG